MILHTSIPAKNPEQVAKVLAELCQGVVKPFAPLKNAFMVYANDGQGSGFEVYPENIILTPGERAEEPSRFVNLDSVQKYSASHVAIVSTLTKDQIMALASKEQWRCLYTTRQNSLNVFELWLENRFLVEIILPEDLEQAKSFLTYM